MQEREAKRRLTVLMGYSSQDLLTRSRTYADICKQITEKFRAEDFTVFESLKEGNWMGLKEIFTEYRCRNEKIAETQLIVYLNCFSMRQIREEFGRFLWEFDENYDGRLQQNEFEHCLEIMARPDHIGKTKVRIGLKAMDVQVDEGINFLKEGPNKDRVVDKQISGQLRELFTARMQSTEKKGRKRQKLNYMEVGVLLPFLFSYWLENELKVILKCRINFERVMGVPIILKPDGSYDIDPLGVPTNLYLSMCRVMQQRVPLDEACITYRIVVKALLNFQGARSAVGL